MLKTPYLLFLGSGDNNLAIKTSRGIAYWNAKNCLGEFSAASSPLTLGLQKLSIKQAAQDGAKTFIIGLANAGGKISEDWITHIVTALEHKMDVASGLHQKLSDFEVIKKAAFKNNCQLHDLRHLPYDKEVGKGAPRSGKRMLMVGTDCSVGKMYTALVIAQEMKNQGFDATFRATGQTGIFIAGDGRCVDAVISDFISGVTEKLSPAGPENHWDIIEGQGSLFNPSFAGVTLGLIHGSQADHLVLCHEAGRQHIKDLPDYSMPSLQEAMAVNLQAARLTNPKAIFSGISLNGRLLSGHDAQILRTEIEDEFNLPCFDPVTTGSKKFVDYLRTQYQAHD